MSDDQENKDPNWKKTPERVRCLEKEFSDGQFVETACAIAEISKDTYYRWYSQDYDFRTRMNKALYTWLKKKHNKLAKTDLWKVVRSRFPHLYKDKVEQEITGQDGGPIKLIIDDLRMEDDAES